jgi:Protein of unknown function (DUF1236)
MSKRFMISVAAIALIAGAGAANAQGTGMKGESGGAAMQHSAPAGGAAADKAAPSEAAPGDAKGQRAEETAPGQKSKGMNAQTDTKGGKDMKAEGREGPNGNMKAEGRDNGKMDNGKTNAETRQGRDNNKMNAETKPGNDRSQTTGQAGAGAKISTEQRTKITTVIRNEHVAPLTNVNFNISVGTRIPRDVSYHTLPTEVVTIYPEWRGYNYVLVRDQIIVIDPQTFEIVAVLDV